MPNKSLEKLQRGRKKVLQSLIPPWNSIFRVWKRVKPSRTCPEESWRVDYIRNADQFLCSVFALLVRHFWTKFHFTPRFPSFWGSSSPSIFAIYDPVVADTVTGGNQNTPTQRCQISFLSKKRACVHLEFLSSPLIKVCASVHMVCLLMQPIRGSWVLLTWYHWLYSFQLRPRRSTHPWM